MKARLLAAAVTLAAALASGCADETIDRPYDNNDLQLITGYTAREMCSCLWVMEQTEDYCRQWTKASPAVAQYKIDHANRRVEAGAVLLWSAKAHFVSPRTGCVLE